MLEITSLTKTFPDGADVVRAIDDFSLNVADGEWVTLLGPSGCGKTTTLRCVAGLETADSGHIRIGDTVAFSGAEGIAEPPNRRPISMVFQSYAIWPHLSVAKNVAFPLETGKPLPKQEIAQRVQEVLRVVGIDKMAGRDATRLSGGQQQRVALARAIVRQSELLLLDEPLSNLDAKLRLEMRSELRSLRERIGMSTLHVTHDQEEALSLADRVVLLRAGRVVEAGAPTDLYHRPRQAFTAEFLGRAELWDADEVARESDGVTIRTALGSFRAGIAGDDPIAIPQLMIRPEHIRMHRADEPGVANGLEGRVVSRMFTGRRFEYVVDSRGVEIRVDRPSTDTWQPGDVVVLELPPERTALVDGSQPAEDPVAA